MRNATETKIGEIDSWRCWNALKQNVFIRFKIELIAVSIGGKDTEFRYAVYAKGRLSQKQLHHLSTWIDGFNAAMRATA